MGCAMSVKDPHTAALRTDFELVCQASIVALVADLGWVFHDVLQNGMSLSYGFIGTGLVIGIVGTAWVLIRHHNRFLDRLIRIDRSWDERMNAIKHRGR